MIVVVEGPSAAGKTTWCQRHGGGVVVPEYTPRADEPDASDSERLAAYRASINSARWRQAEAVERRHGLAVCDSDPLKLHYSWCLARVGAASFDSFHREAAVVRELFDQRLLGMADLVLLVDVPPDELRRRRAADVSRRRRNFDLHVRLAAPLREWYAAVAALDGADRVRSAVPEGIPNDLPRRASRSDPMLLDRLIAALPES